MLSGFFKRGPPGGEPPARGSASPILKPLRPGRDNTPNNMLPLFRHSRFMVRAAEKGRSLKHSRPRAWWEIGAWDVGARFLPAVSPFVATSSRTDNRVCANADRNVGAPRRPPGSLRPAPSLDEKVLPMSPVCSDGAFNASASDTKRARCRLGKKGAGRRPPPLNPGGPRSNGSYLSLGEVVPSTRISDPDRFPARARFRKKIGEN